MFFPFPENLQRVRRQTTIHPVSGEETLGTWAAAVVTPLEGCAIGSRSTSELVTSQRDQVDSQRSLYGPYGLELLSTDRVRDARGRDWDVDGEPMDWRNPFTGWEAGTEVPLTRTRG